MFENYYSFFQLLPVVLLLRDAPKKYSEWTEIGVH